MFVIRGFLYLLAVAGIAQLITLEGYQFRSAAQYSEHALTEHLQDMMSFLSCILFLYAARLDEKLNIAAILLGALLAMMFVRESDSLLDTHVFDGAWQAIVSVIFVVVLWVLRGRFSQVYASLKEYAQLPCFGAFLAGFITIMAFSRLLGRGAFWQAVMEDSYMRLVKNIVEEGIETLGYSLILISAIELVLVCRRRNQAHQNKLLTS